MHLILLLVSLPCHSFAPLMHVACTPPLFIAPCTYARPAHPAKLHFISTWFSHCTARHPTPDARLAACWDGLVLSLSLSLSLPLSPSLLSLGFFFSLIPLVLVASWAAIFSFLNFRGFSFVCWRWAVRLRHVWP
ncbi:hypothetical protein V8C37DRAFT_370723 [Trichoderma ceciliae]